MQNQKNLYRCQAIAWQSGVVLEQCDLGQTAAAAASFVGCSNRHVVLCGARNSYRHTPDVQHLKLHCVAVDLEQKPFQTNRKRLCLPTAWSARHNQTKMQHNTNLEQSVFVGACVPLKAHCSHATHNSSILKTAASSLSAQFTIIIASSTHTQVKTLWGRINQSPIGLVAMMMMMMMM